MHFVSTFVATVSVLASAASAAQFTVNVGTNNGLTYVPTSLSGVVAGDQISFKFLAKNHTITQSTFAAPCVAKAGGVDSGFVPVATGTTTFPEWTIQVDNVTAPLWFFCAQGAHCKAGMVFAINPTADKSFEAFLATAQGTTTNTTTSTTGTTGTTGTTTTGAGTAATTGTSTSSSGTTVVNTTVSGAGAAATTSKASAAFTVTAQKAATVLAALGVVAGLTL